jgi:hypothetical protein
MAVFCVVAPCTWYKLTPVQTALQHRMQPCSFSPLWEPQIILNKNFWSFESYIQAESLIASNYLWFRPAKQPLNAAILKHQSSFRTYHFFFSPSSCLTSYFYLWKWLYSFAVLLQRLYAIKPASDSGVLMHGIHCSSAVFTYQALVRRAAQETLKLCAGLHNKTFEGAERSMCAVTTVLRGVKMLRAHTSPIHHSQSYCLPHFIQTYYKCNWNIIIVLHIFFFFVYEVLYS